MHVTYNSERDTLRILLCDTPIQTSETRHPGLVVDYDHNRRIVGLEIADASKHLSRPIHVVFAETTDKESSRED